MKFYTPTPQMGEARWLARHATLVSYENADTVLFAGGADVSPAYYGQPRGSRTYCDTSRDEREFEVFKQAVADGKNIFGICRGLQAIHAFQGFPLVQHMTNHTNADHNIYVTHGAIRDFRAPGDHHQNPLIPEGKNILLLGYAKSMSDVYLDGNDRQIEVGNNYLEPEIIHYPDINALGVQYHPEWSDRDSDCDNQTRRLIDYVFKTK